MCAIGLIGGRALDQAGPVEQRVGAITHSTHISRCALVAASPRAWVAGLVGNDGMSGWALRYTIGIVQQVGT